jgi:hypothetical protein
MFHGHEKEIQIFWRSLYMLICCYFCQSANKIVFAEYVIIIIIIIELKCKWVFTWWQWYFNKTQHPKIHIWQKCYMLVSCIRMLFKIQAKLFPIGEDVGGDVSIFMKTFHDFCHISTHNLHGRTSWTQQKVLYFWPSKNNCLDLTWLGLCLVLILFQAEFGTFALSFAVRNFFIWLELQRVQHAVLLLYSVTFK